MKLKVTNIIKQNENVVLFDPLPASRIAQYNITFSTKDTSKWISVITWVNVNPMPSIGRPNLDTRDGIQYQIRQLETEP